MDSDRVQAADPAISQLADPVHKDSMRLLCSCFPSMTLLEIKLPIGVDRPHTSCKYAATVMKICAILPFLILAVSGCAVQQSATDLASPASPESTVLSAITRLPTASSTVSPVASPEPTRASTPVSTATIALQPTAAPSPTATVMWNGLVAEAENRCSPYDSDDYPYSQSVEERIVSEMGGIIYGPYTGTYFSSTRETDIEHIVARSEAHDSGLCAADDARRRQFASDLLNLTLASPSVNRHQKIAYDVAEWLPHLNQC